eukprot:CFRG6528T1
MVLDATADEMKVIRGARCSTAVKRETPAPTNDFKSPQCIRTNGQPNAKAIRTVCIKFFVILYFISRTPALAPTKRKATGTTLNAETLFADLERKSALSSHRNIRSRPSSTTSVTLPAISPDMSSWLPTIQAYNTRIVPTWPNASPTTGAFSQAIQSPKVPCESISQFSLHPQSNSLQSQQRTSQSPGTQYAQKEFYFSPVWPVSSERSGFLSDSVITEQKPDHHLLWRPYMNEDLTNSQHPLCSPAQPDACESQHIAHVAPISTGNASSTSDAENVEHSLEQPDFSLFAFPFSTMRT